MKKPLNTIEVLKQRWLAKTDEPMPEWISCLSIDYVLRAVEWTEAGIIVAPGVAVVRETVKADSMREFDGDGFC